MANHIHEMLDTTSTGSHVADAAAAGTVVLTTIYDAMPHVAILLAILWYLVEFFTWFEERREKAAAKRIAKAAEKAVDKIKLAAYEAADKLAATVGAVPQAATAANTQAVEENITDIVRETVSLLNSGGTP